MLSFRKEPLHDLRKAWAWTVSMCMPMSEDFTEDELDIMFGIAPYQAFGRLAQLKLSQGNFQGNANRKHRIEIGEVLKEALKFKRLDRPQTEGVFNRLLDVPFCGGALGTRLLMLAKPDFFVVVKKKSFEGLRKHFGFVGSDKDLDARHYVDLLETIHSQPWYKSAQPDDTGEREIWQARAALIDPIVRREQSVGDD